MLEVAQLEVFFSHWLSVSHEPFTLYHHNVLIRFGFVKGEVGAPWNRFKPSSKTFYCMFQGGTSFVDLLCFCSVLCLLCLCARLFICALWSPAGKGLTSWLSFVVFNCEFVTFPLVSLVRCGAWLYHSWSLHPYLPWLFLCDDTLH